MRGFRVFLSAAFGLLVPIFIAFATPPTISDSDRQLMEVYTPAYCTAELAELQDYANHAKTVNVYNAMKEQYAETLALCAKANAAQATENTYDAWLATQSGAPAVAANSNLLFGSSKVPTDPMWAQESAAFSPVQLSTAWNTNRDCGLIRIYVFDTGVNYLSPDLAGEVDFSSGYNFVANTNSPLDDNGHGTFVSGIIGAKVNNNIGMTGVCWRSHIVPIKVMDASGVGTDANILAGLGYASTAVAALGTTLTIYNMSISVVTSLIAEIQGGAGGNYTTAFTTAGGNNTLVVLAAGNSAVVNGVGLLPAQLPSNVLVVGATDSSDVLAVFSNYDGVTNVYAPGVQMTSILLTNGYAQEDGTSFSTPLTAAAAALYGQYKLNQTAQTIRNLVVSTGDTVNDPTAGAIQRLNIATLMAN